MYYHKRQVKPDLYLNGEIIPHSDNPTILGLTYDPTMTFKTHVEKISNKAEKKINTIKALSGTKFGQKKEDQTRLYKQYVRPSINYASAAWASQTSKTNIQKLQTKQNKALRAATGCISSTPIDHLHSETKVVPLKYHLNMRGTQFFNQATELNNHPCNDMTHQIQERQMLRYKTPAKYYKEHLERIPPADNMHKQIHTYFTNEAITSLTNNLLQAPPPEINEEEESLPREDRVILSRTRCGHLPQLRSYQNRIGATEVITCRSCHREPEFATHVFECPALQREREDNNIHSINDLWSNPRPAARFIKAALFP